MLDNIVVKAPRGNQTYLIAISFFENYPPELSPLGHRVFFVINFGKSFYKGNVGAIRSDPFAD